MNIGQKIKELKDNKNFGLLVACGIIIIVLIIINVAPKIFVFEEKYDVIEHDEYIVDESSYLYYNDASDLNTFTGGIFPNKTSAFLSEIILSNDELKAAGNSNEPGTGFDENVYVITAEKSGMMKGVFFPYKTITMQIKVSDSRYYQINIALNDDYYGINVRRILPSVGAVSLFIGFDDKSTSDYNKNDVIASLIDWTKTIYPEPILVTAKDSND